MATREPAGSFEEVLGEHRDLRAAVAELRGFLEQPRPALDAAEATSWAGALADRLVDFHHRASRHFRAEERSGFFERLRDARPGTVRAIAQLQGEHDRILSDLRSVLEATMVYARHEGPASANLRRWTASALDRFEQHERDETDLVQDVLCDDLGVGD